MLNICALVQRIPHAKNQSAWFRCVPVFFVQKRQSQLFQFLLRRRSFLFLLTCYYLSFSLPLLLRSRPHVPRFDFRLSLLSERGFISREAAGNQVNTWYDVRSCTKSIITFHGSVNTSSLRKLFFKLLSVVFVAQVPCLRVVVSLVRFIVLFSSGHRQPFFVSLNVFFRRILFLEASQWA